MYQTADADGPTLLAGRYEIGALIALGGSAEVHRARDVETGRQVAVKILRPGAQAGRGDREELEFIAALRHPGLVALHEVGVDAGRPYLIMDCVEGGTLAERLRAGPMPVAEVTEVGSGIAAALAHVHAHGVVHRDVKPGNVLLDRGGQPRLTDFGIARLIDAARVTTTGMVIGTAAYMAPEQVRGGAVGPPADVYALGLLLLEAVTGRREYDGTALESAVARLHRAPVVPAAVPDPLAAAIRRATDQDPAARPAAALLAAVLRGEAALPDRGASRGRPVRRLAPLGAVACMLAASVAGTVALAGLSPSGGSEVATVLRAPVGAVPGGGGAVAPPEPATDDAGQDRPLAAASGPTDGPPGDDGADAPPADAPAASRGGAGRSEPPPDERVPAGTGPGEPVVDERGATAGPPAGGGAPGAGSAGGGAPGAGAAGGGSAGEGSAGEGAGSPGGLPLPSPGADTVETPGVRPPVPVGTGGESAGGAEPDRPAVPRTERETPRGGERPDRGEAAGAPQPRTPPPSGLTERLLPRLDLLLSAPTRATGGSLPLLP